MLITSFFMFQSCNDDDKINGTAYPPINEKSYIQGFYDLELDNVRVQAGFGIPPDKEKNKINFRNITDSENPISGAINVRLGIYIGKNTSGRGLISYPEINTYKVEYFKYIDLIGDTSYNSDKMDGLDGQMAYALTDTLRTIQITSNKDFNAEYKAGDNLNSLFSIYFEEPYATIKNGYKSLQGKNYYEVDVIRKEFPYSFYGERLSEVDFSKKYFIGSQLHLSLEAIPDKTEEYTFTITIRNTQGKEVTVSANPIKIKGTE